MAGSAYPGLDAVIFDLDGTLFDHQASARRGLGQFLGGLGVPVTEPLRLFWFTVEARHVDRWLNGEISWLEQRRRRLRDFLPAAGLGVPASIDELDVLFEVYFDAYEAAWAAFEDAESVLLQLRADGVGVAVLTNGVHDQQVSKLARIGLLDLVGKVWASDDLGTAKPDPAAYLRVCQDLGTAPNRTVHIGDNYALDVAGAEAAGLRAIYVDREGTSAPAHSARVTNLRDALALLRVAEGTAPEGRAL